MPCIFRCALCAYFCFSVAYVDARTPVSIQDGYAQTWSNRPGEPATFHINSTSAEEDATLVIYDTLDRPVANVTATVAPQELSVVNLAPWRNGYGYEPVSIDMPEIPSGIYRLGGAELSSGSVPFIINDPDETADIVVIYPTNTVNAYSRSPNPGHPDFNRYSVVNLYSIDVNGNHPDAVSFHRAQNRKVWGTKLLDRVLLQSDYSYKYIADHELESYDAIAGENGRHSRA